MKNLLKILVGLLIFVTFLNLGIYIGEILIHTKESVFSISPREQMESRAIRVVIQDLNNTKNALYKGNGVYLLKGLVLTNAHICSGMQEENKIPNLEYKIQDKYGDIYKIDSFIMDSHKDLCLLKAGEINLKYTQKLKILGRDPEVIDILIGAAYSYANPKQNMHNSNYKFFMFQERRAQILERSTMNFNSLNLEEEDYEKEDYQFFGPLYKLSSLINYGDSGGAVYYVNNEKIYLAGIVFAKEFAIPYPAQAYMVPASSIIQFLKKNNINTGDNE